MPGGDYKKLILIFPADVGFDHPSAANVVTAALMDRSQDQSLAGIVISLDDKRIPPYLRDTQTDYD
jgi:hypothetical protein